MDWEQEDLQTAGDNIAYYRRETERWTERAKQLAQTSTLPIAQQAKLLNLSRQTLHAWKRNGS